MWLVVLFIIAIIDTITTVLLGDLVVVTEFLWIGVVGRLLHRHPHLSLVGCPGHHDGIAS